MTRMTKKMLAGVVAGAILLTGGLTYVQAAQNDGMGQNRMERAGRPGRHQPPQMNKEEAAQRIADTFRVSKDEVLSALNANGDFRDIGQAAMLAKISGKSFQDVLGMKTKDNHWPDVQKSLGITRDQMRAEMNGLAAERIAARGNVDLETAKALLKDGYEVRDIEAAGTLAKASGKSVQSVLGMKKINNRWTDVAKSLGVDAKVLREGRPGPGGPGGMMAGSPGGYDTPGEPPREMEEQ